jgi:hypothetical protein
VPYASHRFAELVRVFRSDAGKLADCLGPCWLLKRVRMFKGSGDVQNWLSFSNSARTGTCHTWNNPIATEFNST